MGAVNEYFATLAERFGQGWNRFWFTPRDPFSLGVVRILVALMALYAVSSYSFDLVRLFGPEGILPPELIYQLRGGGSDEASVGFSYFNYFQSPTELWTAHVLGLAVLLLFAAGVLTRVMSVLALVVVLSYIHRAPLLTGQMEPILAMMLFYLCLGPAGSALSFDAWRARRKAEIDLTRPPAPDEAPRSVAANVAIRLMQVHLAVVYLMMAVGKLADPGEAWWMGEAVWWLAARPGSRMVDVTGLLHNHLYVVNAWSHAIVLFEFSFGLLIWNRLARPLLLALAVPMWLSLALVSGLGSFAAMMLAANVAFVSSPALRRWLDCAPLGNPIQARSASE